MRTILTLGLACLTLIGCNREVPIRADTIYKGGTIYTGLSATDTVEAVAIGDGMIVYAGDVETAIKLSADGAKMVDLGSNVMFPGFTDAHVHLLGVGQRELTLNLDDVTSIENLKTRLTEYRANNTEAPVVFGRGWIETHWPEGRFPMASDIDEVISDVPVILTRADGHALVTNTAGLEAVGITSETTAPDGGAILLDEEGNPTGMLVDHAMSLVAALQTEPTAEDTIKALETGYQVYASRGWTGVQNVSVGKGQLEALATLAQSGDIPLRTYNAVDADLLDHAINRAPSGERLTTRAVKVYMDGALGSRGALLVEPYSDSPDSSGLQLMQHDEALALFEKALDGDVQIAVHAIGDKANQITLDWYEEAFDAYAAMVSESEDTPSLLAEEEEEETGPRWRIEHSQNILPEDQIRFAELGVIASMQPSHAIGDLYFAPSRLGKDRLANAYPWKSLVDLGVVIAGGSDAPVEMGNPLIEFYAASVRKSLDGFSDTGWHSELALSRYEALKLFTQNAAYASFQEDVLGTIETGKIADLTVFDQDLLTIPDEEIMTTKPVMTIVGGDVVWKAD